jgi:hypothetical protein
LEKPDGAIKNGQSRYKAALLSKRHRIEGKTPQKTKKMKELIRVTDSYKCAIKGTGTANPSEVHYTVIYIYMY